MANEKNSNKNYGIRQRTHDGVDIVMDRAERMSESSKQAIANLRERGVEMKENVDGYISKNPEKSVLIAAGVGAVLGAILTATIIRRKH